MSERTPLMRWALAIFVAALLCAGAVFLIQVPSGPRVRLPDGTQLEFLGVTYGKQHRLFQGPRGATFLYSLLPSSIKPALGCRVYERGTETQCLVFWTRLHGNLPERWEDWSGYRLVVIDEHGCEVGDFPRIAEPYAGETITSWEVPSFPRRGRTVGLRLYFGPIETQWPLAAEFISRNPARGDYPQWTSQPLPTSLQEGDLSVDLVRFETGSALIRTPQWPDFFAPDESKRSRMTFRVRQAKRPTLAWLPSLTRIRDATGNELKTNSISLEYNAPAREVTMDFGIPLSPDEDAWKLDFQFVRNFGDMSQPFTPEELWHVRGVRVPRNGMAAPSGVSTSRPGVSLKLLGVADDRVRNPFGERFWVPAPSIHVQIKGNARQNQLGLIRAIDDRGRVLCAHPLRPSGWVNEDNTPGFRSTAFFNLRIPPDSRTLDLTFACCRIREFTLLASPTRLER